MREGRSSPCSECRTTARSGRSSHFKWHHSAAQRWTAVVSIRRAIGEFVAAEGRTFRKFAASLYPTRLERDRCDSADRLHRRGLPWSFDYTCTVCDVIVDR